MPRRMPSLIATALILGLLGCARDPLGSVGSNEATKDQTPRQLPAPTAVVDPAKLPDLLREKVESGGDPKSDRTKATAVEWVAVDGQGQLVVGGLVDFPELDAKVLKAENWFRDPLVTRVIIREQLRNKSEQNFPGSLSILSRKRIAPMLKTGNEHSLSLETWQSQVDLFGTRVSGTVCCSIGPEDQQRLRAAISARVGERLLQMSFPTQPRPTVSVTLKAGGLNEQERVAEAVRLAGLAMVSSQAQSAIVDYEEVSSFRHFVIHHVSLFPWAVRSGDLRHVQEAIEVDGKSGSASGTEGSPPFSADGDWSDLTGDHDRLVKVIPEGAQLYVGMTNASRMKIVVVEAAVEPKQSLDYLLRTYERVVDQIFLKGRGVELVQLILKAGNEVRFMEFSLNEWAVRHFLMQMDQVALEPATLLETARVQITYQLRR